MIKHRMFQKSDHAAACAMWKSWGWPELPIDFLPENGVVVESDGVPVCFAWIYKSDTPICWIENYVCSKEFDRTIRDAALDMLVQECVNVAKLLGFKLAFSSISNPRLGKRLTENGFNETDKGMTNYMRAL